ncbi:MAG: hypothetical protein F7C34_01425 [Desulfurococcales archaeon]|nr:hypothetical protein [Desulfurococcales archaeon]
MPRNTLAWERCDNCGRRAATSPCMVGGRKYNLCPYCQLVMISLGIAECSSPLMRVRVSRVSRAGEAVENLIRSVRSGAARTTRTTRSSRRRTRKKSA